MAGFCGHSSDLAPTEHGNADPSDLPRKTSVMVAFTISGVIQTLAVQGSSPDSPTASIPGHQMPSLMALLVI